MTRQNATSAFYWRLKCRLTRAKHKCSGAMGVHIFGYQLPIGDETTYFVKRFFSEACAIGNI